MFVESLHRDIVMLEQERSFRKLLPQYWKYIIVWNIIVCCSIKISLELRDITMAKTTQKYVDMASRYLCPYPAQHVTICMHIVYFHLVNHWLVGRWVQWSQLWPETIQWYHLSSVSILWMNNKIHQIALKTFSNIDAAAAAMWDFFQPVSSQMLQIYIDSPIRFPSQSLLAVYSTHTHMQGMMHKLMCNSHYILYI